MKCKEHTNCSFKELKNVSISLCCYCTSYKRLEQRLGKVYNSNHYSSSSSQLESSSSSASSSSSFSSFSSASPSSASSSSASSPPFDSLEYIHFPELMLSIASTRACLF